jgi:hypothetical protein
MTGEKETMEVPKTKTQESRAATAMVKGTLLRIKMGGPVLVSGGATAEPAGVKLVTTGAVNRVLSGPHSRRSTSPTCGARSSGVRVFEAIFLDGKTGPPSRAYHLGYHMRGGADETVLAIEFHRLEDPVIVYWYIRKNGQEDWQWVLAEAYD